MSGMALSHKSWVRDITNKIEAKILSKWKSIPAGLIFNSIRPMCRSRLEKVIEVKMGKAREDDDISGTTEEGALLGKM